MQSLPSLEGLNWSQIRTLASELARSAATEEVAAVAEHYLEAAHTAHRQLAVYLLGSTGGARPANLTLLHDRAVPDPDWRVQEALAQAFDAYCAAVGYDVALPLIDAWLADEHPHARRAVTEGLRPWTSKRRAYFARQPLEAIRRLAALRADPSDYVRHSAGNALRDIRRTAPELVDAETATWDLTDPLVHYTYQHVLRAR